jgi:hypothetical protein
MSTNKPTWSKSVAGGLIEFPEPRPGDEIKKVRVPPRRIAAPIHVMVAMAKTECPVQAIADEVGRSYSQTVARLNQAGKRIWLDWEELEAVRAARRGAQDGA